jgi:hypothetical protein
MDADGTYPAAEIPKLLSAYDRGYDLVVGKRTGTYFRESVGKGLLRRILRLLVEFVAQEPIQDINSGMRVFSKNTVLRYFPRLCDSFSFSTSLTLAYLMTAKHVGYVEIDYQKRVGKSKVHLFKDSIRTLQFICQSLLYYDPLRIFILLDVFVIGFGLLCALVAVLFKLTSAFVLSLGCALLAILIFAIGLLSNLLQQIMYHQSLGPEEDKKDS